MREMKKSGAEKKRKQAAKKDVFQLFAEKVRNHKELESRWAVLQETRVEYFRGKDFVSFLKKHPELKDILESDSNTEIDDIANILLSKNLLVRCDRVVKTLRPGKRKLSTWPAHLEIFPFVDCWEIGKQAVEMLSEAGKICWEIVRAAIFGAIWILLGKSVWFFPNILAEEATLRELFRFWPKKEEGERPKWTARLFYAVVAVLVILLLRHHAPDEAARARYQKRVYNIIDDVLEWSPSLALSGMMEKQQTVVNTTDPNNNFTDGTKESTEKVVHPNDMDEEIFSEQQVDEDDIRNVEDTESPSTSQ
ncbi:hypothetical protein RHGRI_038077 [Rhododendron griersonianum]|uniref:Translocation protein SEC62 n=1 Tax=Rhododendron griersonianum TaxID=479676 RepID=A0AAV6HXH1_9ERIC|nr:hypothetical protein RHGRI_038077 [Rhododendron griersonianum]